ncbi:TPA: hypothetical protein ACOEBN_000715 [Stenotrophomonas maltophilia]|uniref:hypothetical protein n=1 Tax=Stenotrophomonas geniculata TaxID=86188 RepID=UPI0018D2B555|nr:hypothetical protein [Stenotrophomonas maltophilia]MBH1561490.1 hypothetical protein [Stenotrophomonas maltophilia]MBH1642268.1 hypothetical protein [Stenotrophomonas maltophilia]MBH1697254.1 hypothetical protein [Stenotrophomonas maltophilia]MBH1710148.1 hypothetical protein [Stenotrophomonas maltophilia]
MRLTVLRSPPGLPSTGSCERGRIEPKAGAKAKAGTAASAFAFEFDLSSPGYPAGEEGAGNA